MNKVLVFFAFFMLGIGLTSSVEAAPKKANQSKAGANKPKLLGTYGAWRAYTAQENGRKVCYMTSFPVKETGKYTKRGDVYLLVAHRPKLHSFDVVSFDAGYPFKKGDQVDVKVVGKSVDTFKLFTEKETAWCADSKTDKKLAQAITKGNKIVVAGKSARGTKTEDTYSLKGSSAAYAAITKACGGSKRG